MVLRIMVLRIILAAVAAHMLGFLWYGPLFGKKWMSLMGLTEKDKEKAKQKGMAKTYLMSFVASLVMAAVLDFVIGEIGFVDFTGATPALWNVLGGALAGALVWLGFVATKSLGSVFWEGKSWGLYFLNTAYDLVNLLLMGAIVGGLSAFGWA